MSKSLSLRMDRIASLSREDSMISSDDDRHFSRMFRCLREIILMSRMEYIKCTETHHMVKYPIVIFSIEGRIVIFGSRMGCVGE